MWIFRQHKKFLPFAIVLFVCSIAILCFESKPVCRSGTFKVELPQDLLRHEVFTPIASREALPARIRTALSNWIKTSGDSSHRQLELVFSAKSDGHWLFLYEESPDTTWLPSYCTSSDTLPRNYYIVTLRKDGGLCSVLENALMEKTKVLTVENLSDLLRDGVVFLEKSFALQAVLSEDFRPGKINDLPPQVRDCIEWEIAPYRHVTYEDGFTDYIFAQSEIQSDRKIVKEVLLQPRRKVIFVAKSENLSLVYLSEEVGPRLPGQHGPQPLRTPELYLFGNRLRLPLRYVYWLAEPARLFLIELPKITIPVDKITVGDRYIKIWTSDEGSALNLNSLHVEPIPLSLQDVRKSIDFSLHDKFGLGHWRDY